MEPNTPMKLIVCLILASSAPALAGGKLVIVGGGLSAANADVHRAFLDARPADRPQIAIIPSASGAPAASARAFADTLVSHGARPQDIVVVYLAQEDDPGTPDIDERRWAHNAADPIEIAKISGAGAIWLTGGDQLRTTSLLAPAGRETPMLAAIRARLADGAVVGGSSAGAAIMSRAMITEGDPLSALLQPVSRQAPIETGAPDNRVAGGGLVMGQGLGFLPRGLVDQHFNARRRLGRLTRALFELPPTDRFGFGIDEDTALVVDLTAGQAKVVGSASVTLLDARAARRIPGTRFGAERVRLAIAGRGDAIGFDRLDVAPAAGARQRPDDPDEDQPRVQQQSGGMAVPEPDVASLLADSLFGTQPLSRLDRPSLRGDAGVLFRFERAAGAAAWQHQGRQSVSGIAFTVQPLAVSISGASQ
jgi:cyanophycinase